MCGPARVPGKEARNLRDIEVFDPPEKGEKAFFVFTTVREETGMRRMLGVAAKDRVRREYLEDFRKCGQVTAPAGGRHSGGWGIAGYLGAWTVHFGRSGTGAGTGRGEYDVAAAKASLSGSRIVIAHLREAPEGSPETDCSHPFIHYDWIFCHDGDVQNSEKLVIPRYRYEGSTGSERFFKYLIDRLYRKSVKAYPALIREAVAGLKKECRSTSLTFLLSGRDYLFGYRDFAEEGDRYTLHCAATPRSFLFCSERLPGFEWREMENGELIMVNKNGGLVGEV
ncbi:MAG: class II glutamine amidotransferase [Endomicrobiales bacterium]